MPGFVQITVPPTSTALTSLSTAKEELNISDSYVDDAYITKLILRASGVIARYTGRTFGQQTVIETFRMALADYNAWSAVTGTYQSTSVSPPWTRKPLILTHLPIASISSVVENSVTLTPDTDYEFEPQSGLLHRLSSGVRVSWRTLVAVTYTGGWITPQGIGTRDLPFEIEEVCLSLIRGAYAARGGDPQVIREVVEGVGRTDYSLTSPMSGMEIDANNALLLAPYVVRVC